MIEWLVHFALKLLETFRDILLLPLLSSVFSYWLFADPYPISKKTLAGFIYVLLALFFF